MDKDVFSELYIAYTVLAYFKDLKLATVLKKHKDLMYKVRKWAMNFLSGIREAS